MVRYNQKMLSLIFRNGDLTMDWKKFGILMPFFIFVGLLLTLIVPPGFKFVGLTTGGLFLITYIIWVRVDKK